MKNITTMDKILLVLFSISILLTGLRFDAQWKVERENAAAIEELQRSIDNVHRLLSERDATADSPIPCVRVKK